MFRSGTLTFSIVVLGLLALAIGATPPSSSTGDLAALAPNDAAVTGPIVRQAPARELAALQTDTR